MVDYGPITGPLNVARQNHLAALLQNGLVLVAGGHPGNNAPTATAETYNPSTQVWTSVASVGTARRLFGACTLASGKVLVAGGNSGLGDVASAELYDRVANTWTATGSLATAREDFSMTCLADGRVLPGQAPRGAAARERYSVTNPACLIFPPTRHLSVLSRSTRPQDARCREGEVMTERTLGPGRVVIIGPLSLILTVWACGGSSSSGLADGGSNLFGAQDDASGGSASSSGMTSSSGSSAGSSGSGGGGIGATSTCIVGTQGCFCDTKRACAPGLTCTAQPAPAPSVCCTGSNCAPIGGPIGSTCGKVTGAAMCTPGITIVATSGSNDGCGYPSSGFNESSIFCGMTAVGGGAKPAVVSVYYSDEHALPLGCATSAFPVSPLSTNPDAVSFPQTGDPACVDSFMRPLRPVLYVTDITADPTCTSGDQQMGGHPYDPVAVFGTWKSATEGTGNQGTPNQADPMGNGWNLGSSADAVPASIMSCNQGGGGGRGGRGGGGGGQGFGTELRFEVGLVSGHSYRLQTIIHDGDQTRGGDSGEGCAVFCAGTGAPVCPPDAATCGSGGSCPTGLACGEDGCCYTPGAPSDGGGIVIP